MDDGEIQMFWWARGHILVPALGPDMNHRCVRGLGLLSCVRGMTGRGGGGRY